MYTVLTMYLWLAIGAFAGVTTQEAVPPAAPEEGAAPVEEAQSAEQIQQMLVEQGFEPEAARFMAARVIAERGLSWQTGRVVLGDDLATIDVGDDFAYLGPEDAAFVLESWGNPPREPTLGMLFPEGARPLVADDAWGVVLEFTRDGYVDDSDAASIDYDALLRDMQQSTRDANSARIEAGYGKVELVGWAEPPHYDSASKKLYWAKALDFGDEAQTLNYDIRLLGRRGVLQMSAVASVAQLDVVKPGMASLLGRVDFSEGHRYADFDPDIDHVAAYGIGALIAGGVAAKAGLFKGLIALLLAGKKFLIAGLVALFAVMGKLFGRGGGRDES